MLYPPSRASVRNVERQHVEGFNAALATARARRLWWVTVTFPDAPEGEEQIARLEKYGDWLQRRGEVSCIRWYWGFQRCGRLHAHLLVYVGRGEVARPDAWRGHWMRQCGLEPETTPRWRRDRAAHAVRVRGNPDDVRRVLDYGLAESKRMPLAVTPERCAELFPSGFGLWHGVRGRAAYDALVAAAPCAYMDLGSVEARCWSDMARAVSELMAPDEWIRCWCRRRGVDVPDGVWCRNVFSGKAGDFMRTGSLAALEALRTEQMQRKVRDGSEAEEDWIDRITPSVDELCAEYPSIVPAERLFARGPPVREVGLSVRRPGRQGPVWPHHVATDGGFGAVSAR